jgi:glycyl-tRNA synthetase beta subunit
MKENIMNDKLVKEAIKSDFLNNVDEECEHARSLHKPLASLHEAYAVLLEEVDEFWDEVKVNPTKLSHEAREARVINIRKELLQIAAMCLRTVMDVERGY